MSRHATLAAVLVLAGWQMDAASSIASADPARPAVAADPERVATVCTACHGAQAYGRITGDRTQWRTHVYEMMLHGAQLTWEDVGPFTDLLSGTGSPRPKAEPPMPTAKTQSADLSRLLKRACSSCHNDGRIAAASHNAAGWDTTLRKMRSYGAKINEEEFLSLRAYLSGRRGSR